jgi:murein DD-endopeptidase MepM/ murein hydrolase activator NlpD
MYYSIAEIDTICRVNEQRKYGRYPVTPDGQWHSGIHVYASISRGCGAFPLIGGQLVAYHIPRDFKRVPRSKKISVSEFDQLQTAREKERYEKKGIMPPYYELKPGEQTITDAYATGFVMLKHSIKVSSGSDSGQEKMIDFFSLYAHIMPWEDKDDPRYTTGAAVGANFKLLLPFYQKYVFRVIEKPTTSYRYFSVNGTKIYEYCSCDIVGVNMAENKYTCRFNNGDVQTTCASSDIAGHVVYKPRGNTTTIYDTGMPKEAAQSADAAARESYKKTDTLLQKARFYVDLQTIEQQTYDGTVWSEETGYYKIYVYESDIKSDGGDDKLYYALVKASDMMLYTDRSKGYLKQNASILSSAANKGTTAGIRVHGPKIAYNLNPYGNAKIIEAGTAFEVSDPSVVMGAGELLDFTQAGTLQTLPERGRFYNRNRTVRDNLLVQIEHNGAYKQDEIVVKELQELEDTVLLGYSAHEKYHSAKSHDVVVFFPAIDFMDGAADSYFDAYVVPENENYYEKKSGVLEKVPASEEMVLRNTADENTPGYTGFYHKGRMVYLPNTKLSGLKKNLLDWKEFRKLDTEPRDFRWGIVSLIAELVDSESDRDGNIFYDKNPEWVKESLTDRETAAIRLEKRKMVCNHPLEWDKKQFLEGDRLKRQLRYIADEDWQESQKRMIEVHDFWEKLEKQPVGGVTFRENRFWFAHPFYFIKYLDRAGLLDNSFNPYLGTHKDLFGNEFTCIHNPGFAPIWRPGWDEAVFKGPDGQVYAGITCLFNYKFPAYYHEGIDFRGSVGTPIHSFIHAKVIYRGWTYEGADRGYGRILIMANLNDTGIYLLAHLGGFINGVEKGKIVNPGDIVAYVGKSGYGQEDYWNDSQNSAPHLHLSYYDLQHNNNLGQEVYGNINDVGNISFGTNEAKIGYGKPSEKDPFNHRESRNSEGI